MAADLESRTRRLEDVQELMQLKWRYAYALDHGFDLDALVGCFTPEARWVANGFTDCRGHEAIRAYFTKVARTTIQVLHYATNPLVTVDEGEPERARIRAHLLCLTTVTLRSGGQRGRVMIGTYDDSCVRREGRWLLEEVRVDVRVNEEWAPERHPHDILATFSPTTSAPDRP